MRTRENRIGLLALGLLSGAAVLSSAAAREPIEMPPFPDSQPAFTVQAPKPANSVTGSALAVKTLTIEAGSGRVISLPVAASSVFAADPKVVEVRPASPTTLFAFGVAPGRTTIAAISASGAPIAQYDITVRPSSYGVGETRTALAHALPRRAVNVEELPNGLAISGNVRTPEEADRAMQLARGYVGNGQEVENRLSVQSGVQVNLRVRIAEMSRNLTRELGINWASLANLGKYAAIGFATNNVLADTTIAPAALAGAYVFPTPGHVVDINGVIDALSQDQLVHVLAEPNLTAISGETASFLVGGEFPIPVAQQNDEVTIEFKQYGVSLAFIPTVGSDGRISLKVRPEVSQLTDQGAVTLRAGNSTIQIPALTVRRAETTVELGSGQSFAIAGLLQDATKLTGTSVPFLGDLPILGALFRSDSFQRNETELVIVVTPYIVRPVADPSRLALPTDGWHAPSDLERILMLRQSGRGGPRVTPATARIPGDAGFIIQ